MHKKKLLLTLNNSHISGIENFVLLLLEYINKDEYEITVAIPYKGNICEKLDLLNIQYYVFNKKGKVYNLKGIYRLLKLILNKNFDIVHANAGVIPCILGKLLRVKFNIEHRHGLDFTQEEKLNMPRTRFIWEKTKKYFTDFTITGCEADRKYLIESFEYLPEKVYTLYNGLSDVSTKPMPINEVRENFVIGTIGRLTYQKGHCYFIKMAKLLNDEITDNNFIFEIWGEGKDKENLLMLIEDLGLTNKVFLRGYADDRESVYMGFDLFVLTSRYEGIPFVILEAMRANLPIITTDVGGINEVIKDNFNGLLVQKENPLLLKEAVLKLYNNKLLAKRLRINAYKDYKNLWRIDKTIDNLMNIYKNHGA